MSMNGDGSASPGGFVGCPFGGGRFPPSKLSSSSRVKKSSRQSKTSVRRQSELFRDYSEDRPFHDLRPPLTSGTEPYSNMELQEYYGQLFIERFKNPECGDLLKNIGLNLFDLLNSLESMHVHLFVEQFPVIRIPYQMICKKHEADCSFLFHFYTPPNSRFTDPENMVAGIIMQASLFAFKMQVSVDMVLEEWGGKSGDIRHCVFEIKEVVHWGQEPVRRLLPRTNMSSYFFPCELLISPKTLCKACPFHVIFDHGLNLVEIGSSLQRLLRLERKPDGTLSTVLSFSLIFELKRPALDELSFEAFLDHVNSVVELKVKESAAVVVSRRSRSRSRSRVSSQEEDEENNASRHACITVRGQMIHVPESNSLLFLGSPLVRTLDDVDEVGLYISDIAIHDATRDLILQNGAYQGHLTLVEQLEKTNSDIEEAQKSLKEQQERSNKLIQSMLPNPVADALLRGEEVSPRQYDSVTIMFSDLTNFAELTAEWEPRQIVDLLNQMYTEFDEILPCHCVYKVETVNDSYMVVGGCPEPNEYHAREVAKMAIDMMDTMDIIEHPITHNALTGQLRIGIHSGSIRAGVVGTERPRYCLFGDTVNITSRTLTASGSSLPGSITITEHTYEKLKNCPEFELMNPKKVQMKGVEKPVTCYTLKRKERSLSIGSSDSTPFRKISKQITFEWMTYTPAASGFSLERRYLGGRSVSCPQPAGNPSFKYSSKPLQLTPRKPGTPTDQSSVSTGHQRCVLPSSDAQALPASDEEKSRGDKGASISSQPKKGRESSSSMGRPVSGLSMGSLGSNGRPVRTSVSQGPEGLMITQMMTAAPGRVRKLSSLPVMPEDEEEPGVSNSEPNAEPNRSEQSSRVDSVFRTDESVSPELPVVVVTCDEDGTDIDEVSLQKLESLMATCPVRVPLQETDV